MEAKPERLAVINLINYLSSQVLHTTKLHHYTCATPLFVRDSQCENERERESNFQVRLSILNIYVVLLLRFLKQKKILRNSFHLSFLVNCFCGPISLFSLQLVSMQMREFVCSSLSIICGA